MNHFNINSKSQPLKNIELLDIGCGGGLLSEPMCRLGAKVTAIDASKKNKLKINYLCSSPEKINLNKKFDVILNMEVVEHVDDLKFFLKKSSFVLKKNGLMFVSTLNKTLKSYVFAIIGAEYILGWLPKGTHDWKKFITPEELKIIFRSSGLNISEIVGMKYNPIYDNWYISEDTSVNYLGTAIKP